MVPITNLFTMASLFPLDAFTKLVNQQYGMAAASTVRAVGALGDLARLDTSPRDQVQTEKASRQYE